MTKIVLISFADHKYKKSLDRLEKEVKEFSLINQSYFLTEKDLDKNFKKVLYWKRHRRGYGYWKWKPYLTKKYFEQLNYNDILIWCDAGNVFNINGIARFEDYVNLVNLNESGILVFSTNNIEKAYTKMDLFKYFHVEKNKDITDTPQIWAGSFFLRKNKVTIKLVNEWYDIHINHYDLTTDKKSVNNNFPEFIEHRHDQSTFSILTKLEVNYIAISDNEVSSKNWENTNIYPIQARRFKQEHVAISVWRKILLPYRYILKWYLEFFENIKTIRKIPY